MSIKVAINGYGRIGRQVLRAIYDYKLDKQLQVVAINASGGLETNAHLTKFDTVHGRFAAEVSHDEQHLIINGDKIPFFSTRNPAELPWKALGFIGPHSCEFGAQRGKLSLPPSKQSVVDRS